MRVCEICGKESDKISKISPITCQKCYDKERYQKNKKRELSRSREYYANNKDSKKQYYENNRRKILDYYKTYRAENIERLKELDRDYYIEHREEILIRRKEYYTENRQKIKNKRENYTQPRRECCVCGLMKIANARDKNGGAICKSCYDPPRKKCDLCKNIRAIHNKSEEYGLLCAKCYRKMLYRNDECFRVKECLRSRLRDAFVAYSKHGKVKPSKKYGIDWAKIFEHIGPCAENGEYHIDHIIPLSMFDFDNELHIVAAFAPENHRWLPKKENLTKGNRCSEKDFRKYMERFYEGVSEKKQE